MFARKKQAGKLFGGPEKLPHWAGHASFLCGLSPCRHAGAVQILDNSLLYACEGPWEFSDNGCGFK